MNAQFGRIVILAKLYLKLARINEQNCQTIRWLYTFCNYVKLYELILLYI
jgi:hypothetical protein